MEALRKPGMIHVKAMAIIARGGKILATRGHDETKNEIFYRLIGGGVHFCEPAIDALRRELAEELETDIENVVFVDVVENIFFYKGKPGHEIIYLFTVDLARTELYDATEIPIADAPHVVAHWIGIDSVLNGHTRLYPMADYAKYLLKAGMRAPRSLL